MLGAASGLSPGPLLALVVAESFQRGFRSGAAVSIAPLITDIPIILAMTLLADALSSMGQAIGWLYLAGSCYLIYLAVEVFRFQKKTLDTSFNVRASLLKGAAVNLLNPAPYAFWFAIGAPLLVQAKSISWMAVFLFLGIFYCMLVGSKLLLAALVGKNRQVLAGRAYTAVTRLLGIFLLIFAVVFIKNGIGRLS